MSDISTHTVTSVEEYETHRDDLLTLFERSGWPSSVTAHPDWVSNWWRSLPDPNSMACALIRDNGILVAAIPLESAQTAGLPFHYLTSINVHWGWASALIDPSCDPRWVAGLARWLDSDAGPWTFVQLGLLPTGQPASEHLRSMPTPWRKRFLQRSIASLALPDGYEGFVAAQSNNLRRKIRRTSMTAAETGLRCYTSIHPTAEKLDAVLGTVSMHSWQGEAGVAVYSDPAHRTFYRLLGRNPGDLRVLLHHVQDATGVPIAYVLAVGVSDVVHHIDTGFDPTAADLSPGLLATLEAIRWACDVGVREVDLGIDADYKARFTREAHAAEGLELTRGPGGYLKRLRSPR